MSLPLAFASPRLKSQIPNRERVNRVDTVLVAVMGLPNEYSNMSGGLPNEYSSRDSAGAVDPGYRSHLLEGSLIGVFYMHRV